MIRLTLIALIFLTLIASLAAIGISGATPTPIIGDTLAGRAADPAHGRVVAREADCFACHDSPSGESLAGGRPLATPIGTIFAPNITPDRDSGIGLYDFKDFVRVMRFGQAPRGKWLYPAMPYTEYARMNDADLWDLFAYLREEVPARSQKVASPRIAWPLSMRWPLAIWIKLFHHAQPFTPDPGKENDWNRGAYLVQGAAHCGACHTPRNLAFAERGHDERDADYLAGAALLGTSPVNLRGNQGDGLGRWSVEDIARLLQSGRNDFAAVHGSMAEVVAESTQYLPQADLMAIGVYLKSLTPAPESGRGQFQPPDPARTPPPEILFGSRGGQIFMDSCAACHRLSGNGAASIFPALAGNPTVLSQDPASLLTIILQGGRLPSTAAAPSALAMPGFAWRYNNAEIAALANFLRQAWGNQAPPVSAAQVANLRSKL